MADFTQQIPTPMSGWLMSCHQRDQRDQRDDPAARTIRLQNHSEAWYEGRRIIEIPKCELRALLPEMMARRSQIRLQTAVIRGDLAETWTPGASWEPHDTSECELRGRADRLEVLMFLVEAEARLSQTIAHVVQRQLLIDPLGAVYGPLP